MFGIADVKLSNFYRNLARDSFWAVVGNGLGNGLLLLAGILIARLLGADLYGEYGVVKSTMMYSATFATFGLGITATKYISQYIQQHCARALRIIHDTLFITFIFSTFVAICLLIGAGWIAEWKEAQNLTLAFRMLSVIIIVKALVTAQQGILAGLGDFKNVGINNIFSGLSMLVFATGLTYLWGLRGALAALLLSQVVCLVLNFVVIRKHKKELVTEEQDVHNYIPELLRFSLPVAMQEGLYAICNWLAIMALKQYASEGDVGIFTAALQWNLLVQMIPNLLANVVLAHLSGTTQDKQAHKSTLRTMMVVNIACAIVPFAVIFPLCGFISTFYGAGFESMAVVLKILLLDAVFFSITTVLKSEFLATGHNWWLLIIRTLKDLSLVILVYVLLLHSPQDWSGAICFAVAYVGASFIYLLAAICGYGYFKIIEHKKKVVHG